MSFRRPFSPRDRGRRDLANAWENSAEKRSPGSSNKRLKQMRFAAERRLEVACGDNRRDT